jgi:UDP-N-acetylmuramoyl-tripeptide--D-alanyl-D-alanine ligase
MVAHFTLNGLTQALTSAPLPPEHPHQWVNDTRPKWVGQALPLNAQAYPIVTDSRLLTAEAPPAVYLALQGERFDGHTFIPQASQQAVAVIVNQSWWQQLTPQAQASVACPVLLVPHTLWAYMALGTYHKHRNPQAKVVGITGSSGKTTVTQGLWGLLSQLAPTQATLKNHNNDIGLTQTLLSLEPATHTLLAEMGMRGVGEIARLSVVAQPDVAVLLNIGPAHIERLGSLEAIAHAKAEIVAGLNPSTGSVVANGIDPYLRQVLPTVWQGSTHWVIPQDVSTTPNEQGCLAFSWQGHRLVAPLPGDHAVINTLLMLETGLALGYSADALAEALQHAQWPQHQRWATLAWQADPQVSLIDDAYNANPASMQAALNAFGLVLASQPSTTAFLVLGGMKELGEFSQDYHTALGKQVAAFAKACPHPVGGVVLVDAPDVEANVPSPLAWVAEALPTELKVLRCATAHQATEALAQALAQRSTPHAHVLVKGSRGYQLEAVIAALQTLVSQKESPVWMPSC